MSILISIVAFIIIFSLLILIHEAGHFFTALWSGVKVKEFGLGMPPKALTLFKWRGVYFTLNWIPFGGFVRMKGQDDFDNEKARKEAKDKDSFEMATLPKRMIIVCAGVIMNAILAFVLIFVVFKTSYLPLAIVPDDKVQFNSFIVMRETFAREQGFLVRSEDAPENGIKIGGVMENSLGENLGLKEGDIILKVNGPEVNSIPSFFTQIATNEDFTLTIKRDGSRELIRVDRESTEDKIGIYLESNETIQAQTYSFGRSLANAAREVFVQARVTLFLFLEMIGGIFTTGELSDDIAGPVGIAQLTHNFTQQGITALMLFTAMLSMSLAVINILPFPALDGGRLVFMIIEGVFRRRVSEKIEGYAHSIGFILLMALIIAVTWQDLMRLFS